MKETIEYQNIQGNRNHKDSLFRKVFRKRAICWHCIMRLMVQIMTMKLIWKSIH